VLWIGHNHLRTRDKDICMEWIPTLTDRDAQFTSA
jgi:hypothetical protein